MKKKKKKFTPFIVVAAVFIILVYYVFFSAITFDDRNQYIYIDNNDNIDSVYVKLNDVTTMPQMLGFKLLATCTSYPEKIRTGRYEIEKGNGVLSLYRKMRSGIQASVSLTMPSVRTIDRLAGFLSEKLMIDSLSFYRSLTDTATCAKYGYTPETMICMFIPNTYDIYWNTSLDKFLEKMSKENRKFWNFERTQKAKAINLTKEEVMTLASIVDEETANNDEKPMIAGMYINRLKAGMPLQADPTIKFALKDFKLKRIYHNMLSVKSPYNTYKNTGLPPGPIRIPSIAGIDAVLNHIHHDYMYMCAKEDFSGTHNFAKTYEEHLLNAAKYSKALNRKGIE